MKKCLLCNAEMVKLLQEPTHIGFYPYVYPNGHKMEIAVQSNKYLCPKCLFVMEFVDEHPLKKLKKQV